MNQGSRGRSPSLKRGRLTPDSERFELAGGEGGPVAVGGGAGGAGVEDAAEFQGAVPEDELRAFGGEVADADQPFRLQGGDDGAQVPVAGGEEGGFLGGGQFVGGAVAAAGFPGTPAGSSS